jgi:hypothetical protein
VDVPKLRFRNVRIERTKTAISWILIIALTALAGMGLGMIYTDLGAPAVPQFPTVQDQSYTPKYEPGWVVRGDSGGMVIILDNGPGPDYLVQDVVQQEGLGWFRIEGTESTVSYPGIESMYPYIVIRYPDPGTMRSITR